MKKIIVLIFSIMVIFVLTACSCNNKSKDPVNNNSNSNNDNGNQAIEESDNTEYDYVPSKALPENLPIYPGATLWSDNETWATEGTNWMWFFNTTGSANEIVEFFTTEFQKLGFEIDENSTFANYEEFFVRDTTRTVEIGWLGSEIEDINPDTPGRGYMIIVNLDAWNKR